MSVVVTGATGIVGSAVVRHLLESGAEVRALVRPGRRVPSGVQAVPGDVLQPAGLARALAGASVVYHLAGVNRMCLRDPTPLYRVNVEGSRNVVRAARAAGVGRLVYTSSAATIGEGPGEVGTEVTTHRGAFQSHYERSKYQAEQVVRTEGADLDLVIVNPSSVQGPGRATGTGKLLIDLVAGRITYLIDTRLSIVDIDDCARGHLLAAERGRTGARYILNSFSMTTQEALALIESVIGERRRVRYLPAGPVTAFGTLVGALARLLRRDGPICREMVRTLLHGHVYDGSLATRELGLVYTEASVTLSRLIAWATRQGLMA